jgi:hypothetical protein
MSALFGLRFDFRNPELAGTTTADRYAAALDMAAWADRLGCVNIAVSEHHGIADGFIPSVPEVWAYYRDERQKLGHPDPGRRDPVLPSLPCRHDITRAVTAPSGRKPPRPGERLTLRPARRPGAARRRTISSTLRLGNRKEFARSVK